MEMVNTVSCLPSDAQVASLDFLQPNSTSSFFCMFVLHTYQLEKLFIYFLFWLLSVLNFWTLSTLAAHNYVIIFPLHCSSFIFLRLFCRFLVRIMRKRITFH